MEVGCDSAIGNRTVGRNDSRDLPLPRVWFATRYCHSIARRAEQRWPLTGACERHPPGFMPSAASSRASQDSVEKEFAQALGRDKARAGLTTGRHYTARFEAREPLSGAAVCGVMTIEGLELPLGPARTRST
jgi:hypothetical protein